MMPHQFGDFKVYSGTVSSGVRYFTGSSAYGKVFEHLYVW